MKSTITLSNLLSVSRIILAPIIILLMFAGNMSLITAFILFLAASLTDYFDGYLARKFNTKTLFGAFVDPLADKVLLFGAFFAFYLIKQIDLWMVTAIVARDIVITMLRIIMLKSGCQLITSQSAKWKTAVQFFAIYILFILTMLKHCTVIPIPQIIDFCSTYSIIPIMMYAVVGFTIWTGITYFTTRRNL